uniref:Pvc16 N-terminal domain-containing protein n=1 Tax=Candidatus Kentrum sp. LPFa TaxID=2126335 RepID=A0A450VVE0_9GAMM|nr:MAG: Protein of unknown function (DUF4255) [Candidatus Kentron sp. LPFa]
MISKAMVFLKDQLNAHLKTKAGAASGAAQDKVVFIGGDKMNPITFESEAVSALLVNIEEERVLRGADPYTRTSSDSSQKVYPDVRMNLYVLFVPGFERYEHNLGYLSSIIGYFQNHRVLDHQNAPTLDSSIEKLVVELITLPLSEQSRMWRALRVPYHPCALYKVKMVVFRDEDAMPTGLITDKDLREDQRVSS